MQTTTLGSRWTSLAEVDSVDEFDVDTFLDGPRTGPSDGAAGGANINDVLNMTLDDVDADLSNLLRSPAK